MSQQSVQPVTRLIRAEETRPLRGAILRPGHPPSASVYEGDDVPGTFHMGIFQGEALVGIASFYTQPMPDKFAQLVTNEDATLLEGTQWRLRGMAVADEMQGRGYGKVLLRAGIEHIAGQGGGLLWCNARSCALGFYRSLNFQTWGDEFEVPDVGPHFVMSCRIEAA